MAHLDFVILKSHVSNSYIVKIYQEHQFLCGKKEKLKIAVFFPAIYPCIEDVPFLKQGNCQ